MSVENVCQEHSTVEINKRYACDMTDDFAGFCALWKYIGAHLSVYGHPPEYRKTVDFLVRGGFMAAAMKNRGL